jgi:hypothetical protein
MPATRTSPWLPALLLLAAAASPALADKDLVVRDWDAAFPVEGAHRLKIDVPVGEVHVYAVAGDRIESHIKLSCREHSLRCREHAARLRLDPARGGNDMTLKVSGYDRDGKRGINHPDLELRLGVPAALAVSVDMGVGDLDLDGIEGDVVVDLGVGEAHIAVPESAVRSVSLDVGIGGAHLSPRSDEQEHGGFLFLGNEVDWREGTGRSRISVNIGVGEASVRLVP